METADEVVARLRLSPHPEGGWYRETWRAAAGFDGRGGEGRGAATAILFLLAAGQKSHWHRVDADELWLFHAGAPLWLHVWPGESGAGDGRSLRLGPGGEWQGLVPAGDWQAAEPAAAEPGGAASGWSLVSCVVAPAFEFSGFELAAPDWAPAGFRPPSA